MRYVFANSSPEIARLTRASKIFVGDSLERFTPGSNGDDDFYASLHALAAKHEGLPPTLFRFIELLGAGDDPLHVDALKALLATFKGVLYEIYVLGEERAESLAYIQKLLQTLDRAAVPQKNVKNRPASFPRPKP